MKNRSAYLLVHGAWRGSWCWAEVAAILGEDHRVFAPTLAGPRHPANCISGINLDTHIAAIIDLIHDEDLDDIVLVGHSYGGMVITGVADAAPDRVRALVYLDAALPRSGDSVVGLLETHEALALIASAGGDGLLVPPPPAEGFGARKAHAERIDRLCVGQPLATFVQAIRLTGRGAEIAARTYVRAAGWNGAMAAPHYDRAAREGGWTLRTVDLGHDMMIEDPEAIAAILADASKAAPCR